MNKIRYPKIAARLIELAAKDQQARVRDLRSGGAGNARRVDKRNTAILRSIVRRIGWPTRSDVGKRGAHAAWLLVQHVDHNDLKFQVGCLAQMQRLEPGEVDLRHIAYLADRVCVNARRPQMFGTQFHEVRGGYVAWPIEKRRQVNKRRLAMGLGTLAEGRDEHQKKYARFSKPSRSRKQQANHKEGSIPIVRVELDGHITNQLILNPRSGQPGIWWNPRRRWVTPVLVRFWRGQWYSPMAYAARHNS